MKIRIASILTSYTSGVKEIEVQASTVIEALEELEKSYPGIRFRFITEQGDIRPHMNLFLNKEVIYDLNMTVTPTDELYIVQSLSGG